MTVNIFKQYLAELDLEKSFSLLSESIWVLNTNMVWPEYGALSWFLHHVVFFILR